MTALSRFERDDGGIAIRPFRESDDERLFEAGRESIAEVGRWLPWCHPDYALRDAREWVAFARAQFECDGEYHFAVVALDPELSTPGAILGGVGLNELRRPHGVANLGYWVRTGAAGRGVCTRAVRLLAPLSFELGLTRLEILASRDNAASLRVAEKAGAVREGVLRDRLRIGGELHDAVCCSIVPSDLDL